MERLLMSASRAQSQQSTLKIDQVLDELKLERNPQDPQDEKQLQMILTKYLFYPSDHKAKVHMESYRLGDKDQGSIRQQLKQEFLEHGLQQEVCPCCCCLRQDDLSFATRIETLETIGESLILYFVDMRYTASLLLMSFLTYGLFALITNIYAGPQCQKSYSCAINQFSLGAKLLHPSHKNAKNYIIQVWLGVIMVVFWYVFFVFKSLTERRIENQQDIKNTTASDFSVMIENLPKHYTIQTFQRDLNKYCDRIQEKIIYPNHQLYQNDTYDGRFTISRFNSARAYYQVLEAIEKDEKQQPLQKRLNDDLQELREWIKYRQTHTEFPVDHEERQRIYQEIDQLRKQIRQRRQMLTEVIEQDFQKLNESKPTKLVFVTFNHSYARINFQTLNKPGFIDRIHDMAEFNKYRMQIEGIKVSRAPEPEDIVWENIGLPKFDRTLRKAFTFSMTVVILCVSGYLIYLLTTLQLNFKHSVVSILVSLVIVGFNSFLSWIITRLTRYEKDYRATFYQVSLGVKIVGAQLINSVILSFIAAYFIKKNIYRPGGLADDVFWFGVSNAFVSPIIRLIDFFYQYTKFARWKKSQPINKIQFETQLDYNQLWQGQQFQIGSEYVYLLKTSIYTCFYISLQPVIALLSALGITCMYFVHRYILYYRASRPRVGSNIVNKELNNILRLSLIAYATGSIIWTQIITIGALDETLLPNLIALGLGVLVLVYPRIFKAFKLQNDVPLVYEKERMFLASEYDRLNPCTREEGIRDFKQFFERKRLEYAKVSQTSGNKSVMGLMKSVMDKIGNPLDMFINVSSTATAQHEQKQPQQKQQPRPNLPPFMQSLMPMAGGMFGPFAGNLSDFTRDDWNPIQFGLTTILQNFEKLSDFAKQHYDLHNVRHQQTFKPIEYLKGQKQS